VEVTERITVALRREMDDGAAVEEALKRAEQGQQVLWIENTVAEAQARYSLLSARAVECGIEAGLIHSRFVQADRDKNEKTWVGLFGTAGKERRKERGRILVGTQVLEQSLDIDADFLVTRLCPTDMLLQRIGRLWRHREHDSLRPPEARCEAWILAADYSRVLENYKKEFGATALVYAPYVLLRTLEVWENQKILNLPGDIRGMVEATYVERDEKGLLASLKGELEKERERLGNFARGSLSKAGTTQPESKAETRYADRETRDLLLFRSVERKSDGTIALILSDGEALELPRDLKHKSKKEWRRRAAALSRHIVTVPENRAPLQVPARILEWFKDYIYTGNREEEEGSLRVALIKKSGELAGIDYAEISHDFFLFYDDTTGYRSREKGRNRKGEEGW